MNDSSKRKKKCILSAFSLGSASIYLLLVIVNTHIPHRYPIYRKDTSLLCKTGVPFDQKRSRVVAAAAALKFSTIKREYN